MDDAQANADFFCTTFYGPSCVPVPGFKIGTEPKPNVAKMHSAVKCSTSGVDVKNTNCFGEPCKIGLLDQPVTGVVDLVCACAECREP